MGEWEAASRELQPHQWAKRSSILTSSNATSLRSYRVSCFFTLDMARVDGQQQNRPIVARRKGPSRQGSPQAAGCSLVLRCCMSLPVPGLRACCVACETVVIPS